MPSADESPVRLPIVLDRYEDPNSDPEFATRRRGRGRPWPVLLPQQYQRLVTNPFLALAGLIAWRAFFPAALRPTDTFTWEIVLVAAVLSLFGLVFLLHFHCLDCGRSGWLPRWKEHACAAVVSRQRAHRVRHWRGPTPGWQLALWVLTILAASFLRLIAQ